MVLLAAAALAAAPLAQPASQASEPIATPRQAQATVRIVSSAALRFSEIEHDRPETLRQTVVRDRGGAPVTIKLFEFE